MLDIAIIGAGPAGLSAAINGKIRNKKLKVFGKNPNTSYLYKAEKVDNYLGFKDVTGPEMIEDFVNHAKEMGVEIEEAVVLEIISMGDYYILNIDNEFVEAKSVIIANGLSKGKSMPGEDEFLGKGASYCATCDAPLYRGKTVALIGETREAEKDADFLSEICEKVYYIPLYKDQPKISDKIEIINSKPKEILGDDFVKGLSLEDRELEVDGVFIAKETIPTTQLVKGLELENKAVKVNRKMETNFPGVYAAGDCTGLPHQVSKAVGEGVVAALQATSYLHKLDKKLADK